MSVNHSPTPVDMGPGRSDQLSPREREILLLTAHGMSDAEISGALSISPRTVGSHLANIREKLRAKNRTHLVARALRAGLLAIRTEHTSPSPGGDVEGTFHLTGGTRVLREIRAEESASTGVTGVPVGWGSDRFRRCADQDGADAALGS